MSIKHIHMLTWKDTLEHCSIILNGLFTQHFTPEGALIGKVEQNDHKSSLYEPLPTDTSCVNVILIYGPWMSDLINKKKEDGSILF